MEPGLKIKLKFSIPSLYRGILQTFLIVLLILYLFVENEYIWALYIFFLTLIVFLRRSIVFSPSVILLVLLLPLIWGLIMSLDNDFRNTAKGFFYLSVPLVMVMIGIQMERLFDLRQFFVFIRNAGNVISLIFITLTIARTGWDAFVSPYTEARFIVGSGSPACVMSLILGIYSNKFGMQLYNNRFERWLFIFLNLVAIYLFASRIYWVMLVLFVILFSIKTMKKDNLLITLGIIVLIFFIITIWVNAQSGLSFSNSLLYKLINSINEIKIREIKDYAEITTYFRGYEAFRSWETYSQGNLLELIFGGGFGQLVDLKVEVLLAGNYWRYVPWVHNGFFFILVKQGAGGLFFIALFFLYLIQTGVNGFLSAKKEVQLKGVMILSATFSLFMINFVSCGLFNFEISLLMITIGFMISNYYKTVDI